MKAILGMLKVLKGKVMLAEQDITIMSPQQRVQLGMAFVPQTNNVFSSMTVEENLELGAYVRTDDYSDTMDQVYELFPVLKESVSNRQESFPEVSDNKWLWGEL